MSDRLADAGPRRSPIDVTLTIGPDLMVWPGDPAVAVEPRKQIRRGDAANVSLLSMGTHTGTHVDPPNHFIEGAGGIDTVPLEALVGPAFVADLRPLDRPLDAGDLEAAGVPEGTERLLLRTANSDIWRRVGQGFPER
ncbi:MAG: cyclase family protein, partial [Actinobacteria bacterium]|nr:cyclase family protein [Actinomycetota bacterium]